MKFFKVSMLPAKFIDKLKKYLKANALFLNSPFNFPNIKFLFSTFCPNNFVAINKILVLYFVLDNTLN